MRRHCAAWLAAALLAGCGGETHHIAFRVAPDDSKVVRVFGSRPTIQVTNEGPGTIEVTFESLEDASWEVETLAVGVTERELNGPVVVRMETAAEDGAGVTVSARSAKGVGLDRPEDAR